MSEKQPVAIVGSGPAACMAAWALHLKEVPFCIYTQSLEPSTLRGAQYLHYLPPGLEFESAMITYSKFGTREGYAKKIYGDGYEGPVSWDKFPAGEVPGWPLRKVYAWLHDFFRPSMLESEVDRDQMNLLCDHFEWVFNTAPGHLFASNPLDCGLEVENVWVVSRDVSGMLRPVIIYDGREVVPFYRVSYLENTLSVEYPWSEEPPEEGCVKVVKPLSMAASPMRSNIVPVGRYGQWKKGVLVDEVFKQVIEFCDAWG